MRNELRNELEKNILFTTVQDEFDFVSYLNKKEERIHTIIANQECKDMMTGDGEDYKTFMETYVSLYVHPKDREYCLTAMSLSNIVKELETKQRMIVPIQLLCNGIYRRKEVIIFYQSTEKDILVFTRRDITESYQEEAKQKESLYQAMLEAKHANREKNEFLERMSHEIRTPLNSILGLSYLSKENITNEKKVLENLEKIDKSAHFLLSFINDILNLSQIESGNIPLNEEETNFDTFLAELNRHAEKKAKRKRIHYFFEKRGKFENEYQFDADKLGKALDNVIDNAIKFTQLEGRVDFIVELLRETSKEAAIRIEIRDNGRGMDTAFLLRAFEAFEQEKESGTTLAGGTGLGLAVARNNVEYMGGTIALYSEKGKGTTAVIAMKMKKTKNKEESLRKQSKSVFLDYDFSGKRLLLVEDNEINVEITRNVLEHKKLEVDVAFNGEEGIQKFLEHEAGYYDVILMDIRMPIMDGLEATRKIRQSQHQDHERIPIIAMTANAFEEDVKKSFDAGMNAHLSKPVDVKQMYSLLDEFV